MGRFLLFAFALSMFERLFALHPRRFRRDRWKTDVLHLLFNNLLISLGLVVSLFSLAVTFHRAVNPVLQGWVTAQPALVQFVEAVLVADLAQYWAHRLTHEVPLLWRFHKVHHSTEEMDWLAAARLHPVDSIFTRSVTIFPLYLLGFTKATFGAYLGFTVLQALFIHANVRFRFGPLRWITATPEFHHWHHALESANTNFAGNLPLLDVVFGTCHLPAHMPDQYGIGEPAPRGYVRQLRWPFVTDQAAMRSEISPSAASTSIS